MYQLSSASCNTSVYLSCFAPIYRHQNITEHLSAQFINPTPLLTTHYCRGEYISLWNNVNNTEPNNIHNYSIYCFLSPPLSSCFLTCQHKCRGPKPTVLTVMSNTSYLSCLFSSWKQTFFFKYLYGINICENPLFVLNTRFRFGSTNY